jgi:hypothetical protein
MIKYMDSFVQIVNNNCELLIKISEESAAEKNLIKKWSQKEILGHLIDSANVNYNRIINSVSKDDLVFDTYPQDVWVEIQSYNNREWMSLILLWNTLNLHIAEIIKNIPEDKRTKLTSNHNFNEICWKQVPREEKSSLDYLIKDYIGHLEHHLKQIFD